MFIGQGIAAVAATVVAGLLGSFRGGEILPTGHTTITRILYAVGMAGLVIAFKPVWLLGLALAVSLFVATLINNSAYQQPGVDNYGGMALYGLLRGIVIAGAVGYWIGVNAILLPIAFGVGQGLAYLLGWNIKWSPTSWLAGGTQKAEFLLGIFQFLALLGFVLYA